MILMIQLSILFCEKQRTQSSEDLRSVHTRRQVAATSRGDQITPCVQVRRLVAATRCDDTSQPQITSCVLENFCETLCLRNRILSLQHVAKNQIRLKLCDLLRRQNSVAATKIFTKNSPVLRSDLSLQRVVATCCCNLSPIPTLRSVHTRRQVAATNRGDRSLSVYRSRY